MMGRDEARSARAGTPLHARVPRPPPIFVGREEELAWLSTAFTRSNVVVISGWAGIGKSALVAAFSGRGGLGAGDAICVRGESARSVYAQLCAIWGEGTDPTDIDGSTFGIIEGMERHGRPLVIEDGHRFVDLEELTRLVTAFAKWHTGPARLIVLSRARLSAPEIAEQSLWVPPLPDERVEELIRRCAPAELDARVASLVRAARGSPLEARRLLEGSSGPTPAQLADLTEDALALAAVIAAVERLPGAVLGGALSSSRQLLGDQRIVEQEGDCVGMPERHRDLFAQPPAHAGELAALVAQRLIDLDLGEWRWSALVLARMSSRTDLVDSILADADEGFADVVGGQRLFELLDGVGSNEALRMRLLCVHIGPWQEGLAWLATLRLPEEPRVQLAFALALFAASDLSGVERVLRALASRDVDAATRLEALIGLVKVSDDDRVSDLRSQLSELPLDREADQLRRDVWLAYARFRLGERRAGQAILRTVFARRHVLRSNPAASRRELYPALAFLSLFDEARRLAAEEALTRRRTPRWAYLAAILGVETCDEPLRAEQVARLQQVAAGSTRYEFLATYLEERGAVHVDLTRARSALSRMWTIAEALSDARFLADCRLYELELGLYLSSSLPERLLADDGVHAPLVSLVRLRRDGFDPGATARAENGGWQAVLCAERAFARGDFEEATTVLEEAVAEARQRSAVLEEAELLAARAQLVLRWPSVDVARAGRLAEQLTALADRCGLAELGRLGEGVRLFVAESPPSEPALRALAEGAGWIARLARALLGDQELAWKCDRDALDGLRRRSPPAAEPARLAFDEEAFVVRVGSAHRLELGNHRLLFRLLQVLGAAKVGATKERLSREVWGVPSYRSERDDKRIQVAVARLRSLIAAASFPISIVTTPTGYAIGP